MAQSEFISFPVYTELTKLRELKNAVVHKVQLETKQSSSIAIAKTLTHLDAEKRKSAFYAEKSIIQNLDHKNVCQFIDAFVDSTDEKDPVCTIFTEYVSRGSVFDVLKESELQQSDKLSWMMQATDAVEYIHSRNIVHKDIRSMNFFVAGDYTLKLSEFSYAKRTAHTRISTTTTRSEENAYAWKAPEVLKTNEISKLADIYSMAVFFWELITKAIPFEAMSKFEIMQAVIKREERPIIKESWSEKIKDLLTKCWTSIRKDRPTAEEIRKRLSVISVDGKLDQIVHLSNA